mgnify:CR=1 FL=1
MIVEVPIYSSKGPLKEKVEIQLRTVAMDYWSVLEYQIFYKKTENEEVAKELKTYADEISELDAKMLKLRDKIEKCSRNTGKEMCEGAFFFWYNQEINCIGIQLGYNLVQYGQINYRMDMRKYHEMIKTDKLVFEYESVTKKVIL